MSGSFLGIAPVVSSKFHGARNPYKVVHDRPDFPEKKICPQNWENGPKMGRKHGFLNLLKTF